MGLWRLLIKELRKRYRNTQEKLSAVAEIDYKYLVRIERNTPPALKIETIEKHAKALTIPLSKLIKETESSL